MADAQNVWGGSGEAKSQANAYREGGARANVVRFAGGGGSGGTIVDSETKNYVDANMRAVKAENSASFARLEAKIDQIKPGSTWQQNAAVMISGNV